jgi:hypothetical protein
LSFSTVLLFTLFRFVIGFLCRILLNYRHFDYRLEHISVYFDIEDTTAGFREAL